MSKIWDFFQKHEIFKKTYVWIIIIAFYIPLLLGAIFSFNKPSDKGFVSTSWNKHTFEGYVYLVSDNFINALINSLIIGIVTVFFVLVISLFTVFSIWKQKLKLPKRYVNITSNIPLINPDIITAISLAIILSFLFGILNSNNEGMIRAIISHITMTLPYGILLMYPRSENFSMSVYEASQDLGYSKLQTWFRVYLFHMIPSIFFSSVVVFFFSFDDFIITRITSNASTIGVNLYQGQFKTWSLALGTIMLCATLIGNVVWIIIKLKKGKKHAKV
ncbi:ABC transporter permease [Mesomycoplasma neurolyticum]|uniref:Spermidine/putrescine ABC transporter membrane protein n=1 Tax=Mesomycoplasma neurolyticum TaxID=2120 RepID=A0A449A5J7_9BACT|nr:ABC transporter permease subunit [Mesomycoplasma neurolyticum]VEU59423.1 spermidine/putrescine ABC transporter membrane protein [Mesomycoplasma neurolyticum]